MNGRTGTGASTCGTPSAARRPLRGGSPCPARPRSGQGEHGRVVLGRAPRRRDRQDLGHGRAPSSAMHAPAPPCSRGSAHARRRRTIRPPIRGSGSGAGASSRSTCQTNPPAELVVWSAHSCSPCVAERLVKRVRYDMTILLSDVGVGRWGCAVMGVRTGVGASEAVTSSRRPAHGRCQISRSWGACRTPSLALLPGSRGRTSCVPDNRRTSAREISRAGRTRTSASCSRSRGAAVEHHGPNACSSSTGSRTPVSALRGRRPGQG